MAASKETPHAPAYARKKIARENVARAASQGERDLMRETHTRLSSAHTVSVRNQTDTKCAVATSRNVGDV